MRSLFQIERRVLSRPAEVLWAGFRSTTSRLQQAGWEIAAEESIADLRIRLLLRNRDMRLYALTSDLEFDYHRQHEQYDRPLVFNVVCASPEFRIRELPTMTSFADFHQIDAMPQITEQKIKSIEDFRIFATPLVRTEEIIVEPQDVSAMLEQIRKMQAPEQARIRAKERLARRREETAPIEIQAVPRQAFHAQIISINDRDWRQAA